MASNWQVEARGLGFWKETSRTVSFDGTDYKITFAELRPETLENAKIEDVDDHTVRLSVEDPNGLV